jgi:hypothetical protein
MAIENCGLPSGPRPIAGSWSSYLLVVLLTLLNANDAPVKTVKSEGDGSSAKGGVLRHHLTFQYDV